MAARYKYRSALYFPTKYWVFVVIEQKTDQVQSDSWPKGSVQAYSYGISK